MQQSTRIHSLDIIRGIAILCILFANLPMTGLDPFNQVGYSGTDKVIRFSRFVYTSKVLHYFRILIWSRILYLYEEYKSQRISHV